MARVRLQRFLSQAGVAARRKAEALITSGRVTVNGEVVTELGTTVDPDRDRVQVDGQAARPEELFYLVLNKPKGCLTAVSDTRGRRTVMEYLIGVPVSVYPVGRLDYYSEGVLLMTNDGDLAAALLAPGSKVEKTYHVKVRGKVTDGQLATLARGVKIAPRTVTRPAAVDRLKGAGSRHDWLVITLTEGKSRQIHRMLDALGHQVLKIQRVAFAGITYFGLRVGDARELTQTEVSQLYDLAGLRRGPRAVARGKWRTEREESEQGRRARDRARAAEATGSPPAGARTRREAPGAPRAGSAGERRSGARRKAPAEGGRSASRGRAKSSGTGARAPGGGKRPSSGSGKRPPSGGGKRPPSGGGKRPPSGGGKRPSSGGRRR